MNKYTKTQGTIRGRILASGRIRKGFMKKMVSELHRNGRNDISEKEGRGKHIKGMGEGQRSVQRSEYLV